MTSELRPAVAVWIDAKEAYARSHKPDPKDSRVTFADPFAPAAIIEADREAVRAEVVRAIEVELSMCAIANVEAPSEWIDGFEFAWKRVKAVLEKQDVKG